MNKEPHHGHHTRPPPRTTPKLPPPNHLQEQPPSQHLLTQTNCLAVSNSKWMVVGKLVIIMLMIIHWHFILSTVLCVQQTYCCVFDSSTTIEMKCNILPKIEMKWNETWHFLWKLWEVISSTVGAHLNALVTPSTHLMSGLRRSWVASQISMQLCGPAATDQSHYFDVR